MTTRREDRLQKAEAQADPKIHNGVIVANTRAEANAIIRQRIADGTLGAADAVLIVPTTCDSIEEWQQRQGDCRDALRLTKHRQ